MQDWDYTPFYIFCLFIIGIFLYCVSYLFKIFNYKILFNIFSLLLKIWIFISVILTIIILIDSSYKDDRREEKLGEFEFGNK